MEGWRQGAAPSKYICIGLDHIDQDVLPWHTAHQGCGVGLSTQAYDTGAAQQWLNVRRVTQELMPSWTNLGEAGTKLKPTMDKNSAQKRTEINKKTKTEKGPQMTKSNFQNFQKL